MAITLSGTTGINSPTTQLAGSTSGVVTLTGAAVAGTWTMTLPTSGGTSGYVLGTDGTGVTSWVAQSGGGGGSISVSDEGSLLTSGVTSFNFVGAGVAATAVGNAVTVTISGSGGSSTGANIFLADYFGGF
jgi:hypothetical protein